MVDNVEPKKNLWQTIDNYGKQLNPINLTWKTMENCEKLE